MLPRTGQSGRPKRLQSAQQGGGVRVGSAGQGSMTGGGQAQDDTAAICRIARAIDQSQGGQAIDQATSVALVAEQARGQVAQIPARQRGQGGQSVILRGTDTRDDTGNERRGSASNWINVSRSARSTRSTSASLIVAPGSSASLSIRCSIGTPAMVFSRPHSSD